MSIGKTEVSVLKELRRAETLIKASKFERSAWAELLITERYRIFAAVFTTMTSLEELNSLDIQTDAKIKLLSGT